MNEFIEIFSERLRRARVMRGLSMDALCALMNNEITKQTVSKYEKGKMMPGSANLILLSNALGVPVDYFFREKSCTISAVEFRKKARLGVRKVESIKEEIRDSLEKYMEIEEICDLRSRFENPVGMIEVSEKGDVRKVVEKLKAAWNLGDDAIFSAVDLLESHNVKVLQIDVDDDAFDGLSGYVNDNHELPFVVVRKGNSVERKRFTLLHELGHIVMNFVADLAQDTVEHLCHFFASEMLISTQRFVELIGERRPFISLKELKAIQEDYGISVEALMYKAKDLGVISEGRFRSFCIRRSSDSKLKEWIEKSVFPDNANVISRFERLVFRAFASEAISSSKAASLLGKSIENVNCAVNLV